MSHHSIKTVPLSAPIRQVTCPALGLLSSPPGAEICLGAVIANGNRGTMSATTTQDSPQPLVVVLTAEEANAIVYTIAFQAVAEAECFESMPVSSRPLDLLSISLRCARISHFAAINDQLAWWARYRGADGTLVVTAADVVLRELVAILEAMAVDRIRFPDGELENFAFTQAADSIRRRYADNQAPDRS